VTDLRPGLWYTFSGPIGDPRNQVRYHCDYIHFKFLARCRPAWISSEIDF